MKTIGIKEWFWLFLFFIGFGIMIIGSKTHLLIFSREESKGKILKPVYLILIVFMTLSLLSVAQAAPTVMLNGNQLSFEVPPTIEDGRTLVPLRAIFEALGTNVEWNSTANTITAIKGDIQVKLQIGARTAYKNGSPVTIDVPAQIVNGRTLVPLRVISEVLGADVSWDGNTQTVYISTLNQDSIADYGSPGVVLKAYIKACANADRYKMWNYLGSNLRYSLGSLENIDQPTFEESVGMFCNGKVAEEKINGNEAKVVIVSSFIDETGNYCNNCRYEAKMILEDGQWKVQGDDYNEYYKSREIQPNQDERDIVLQNALNWCKSKGLTAVMEEPYGHPKIGDYVVCILNISTNGATVMVGEYPGEPFSFIYYKRTDFGEWIYQYDEENKNWN